METIITIMGSDVWTVLITLISVILVFVGIVASKVLLLLAKKLGIDVDDQTMKTIQSLVNKLVQAMNQSVVNDRITIMVSDWRPTSSRVSVAAVVSV